VRSLLGRASWLFDVMTVLQSIHWCRPVSLHLVRARAGESSIFGLVVRWKVELDGGG